MSRIDHWMMFGTFAQQDYFAYPRTDSYRGVVINANMAAHAPAGLAAFLHEKTESSRYIIDPLTHAFQHDPKSVSNNDGEVKTSVRAVADAYGDPVASRVGKRPVLPSQFERDDILETFVKNCLEFQQSHLASYMSRTNAAKYLFDHEREVPPYAVVAPYFFMSETTYEQWLPVNERAAIAARAQCNGRLFGAVVIDKGCLEDDAIRSQIADVLVALELDGFLVWIDDFNEQQVSRGELVAFQRLCSQLKSGNKEVINLHGGFFSILTASVLGGRALSGVTHGPEFGEFRGVEPVGGGIPISRYYVPQLHARIRYQDASFMFKELGFLDSADDFHREICECDVCINTLGGDAANFARYGDGTIKSVRRKNGMVRISFPTKDARIRCLTHYLQRKHREYLTASQDDSDMLKRSVSRGYYKFLPVLGLDGVRHLRLWLKALGSDIVPESEL